MYRLTVTYKAHKVTYPQYNKKVCFVKRDAEIEGILGKRSSDSGFFFTTNERDLYFMFKRKKEIAKAILKVSDIKGTSFCVHFSRA